MQRVCEREKGSESEREWQNIENTVINKLKICNNNGTASIRCDTRHNKKLRVRERERARTSAKERERARKI